MRWAATSFLLAVTACAPGAGDAPELPRLDSAVYARDVHPILEARCATLDCHGVMDRPLRLYAETGLRARDDLRDQPIEAAELEANVLAVEGLDPGVTPDQTLFARKPLAARDLGIAHEGGVIWRADEAQRLCVLAWIEGTSDEPDSIDACSVAADEVALPDP